MARPGHERFTRPTAVVQRRYELLRAYYVEELSAAEIAERFGCGQASVRTLISRYRAADLGELFASPRPGPRRQPKKDAARGRAIELRSARDRGDRLRARAGGHAAVAHRGVGAA